MIACRLFAGDLSDSVEVFASAFHLKKVLSEAEFSRVGVGQMGI